MVTSEDTNPIYCANTNTPELENILVHYRAERSGMGGRMGGLTSPSLSPDQPLPSLFYYRAFATTQPDQVRGFKLVK